MRCIISWKETTRKTTQKASKNYSVNYGHHLLLTTETKPFTELQTFASGMGFVYIDDNGKFVAPFGFNRLNDKTFVGICMESWDEFKEDINSHSSRYYQFLELL